MRYESIGAAGDEFHGLININILGPLCERLQLDRHRAVEIRHLENPINLLARGDSALFSSTVGRGCQDQWKVQLLQPRE